MPVTATVNSLSSSLVYLQSCSVCKGEFYRRTDWLKHLTQENHQKLARKACKNQWDSELRKICLVVYTSEPLAGDKGEEIVNYFSRQVNGGMVTDFVWWEDRPHIAVLQFESSAKVGQILSASGCQNSLKIRIGFFSQWVQVKIGVDLLELEWHAIPASTRSSASAELRKKRKSYHVSLDEGQDDNQSLSPDSKVQFLEADRISPPPPKKIMSKNSSSLTTLTPTWTPASHPLQYEYWTIQKTMQLPDSFPKRNKMEFQVFHLLEHLCQFDTRARPFIKLVNHWATLNSINVAGQFDSENPLELSPQYTLPWLVIFFFCYKEYLPTPREIIARNPDKNVLKCEFTGINIGFSCDPTFVKEWKMRKGTTQDPLDVQSDQFLLSLIELFYNFLVFCYTSFGRFDRSQAKVAILQDGNLTSIKALLRHKPKLLKEKRVKNCDHWRKVMTLEEITTLQNEVRREKLMKEFCGTYMTHPFLFSHKISLAQDIRNILSLYRFKNLRIFLSKVEQVGVNVALMEFGGLKKLLTIEPKV